MWNWKLLSDACWAGRVSNCLAWLSLFFTPFTLFTDNILSSDWLYLNTIWFWARGFGKGHHAKRVFMSLTGQKYTLLQANHKVLYWAKGVEWEREIGGRKEPKMFLDKCFLTSDYSWESGWLPASPQIVCAGLKGLLDRAYLPNSKRRGYFPQGTFQSRCIKAALPTWILVGFRTLVSL